MRKSSRALLVTLFAVASIFLSVIGALAAEDSACISCHTNPDLLDELTPVVTKTSTGG
ncbi:MAG: hypothetical protein H0Z38_04925 [Firmicutes bacterium]|nr:hypothetical protein [Bacillota bacterium]